VNDVYSVVCLIGSRSKRSLHTLHWLQKLKLSGRKTYRSVRHTLIWYLTFQKRLNFHVMIIYLELTVCIII